jgi:signal transduction histidine kinase
VNSPRSTAAPSPPSVMNAWWRARPSKCGQPTWPVLVALLTIPLVGIVDYYVQVDISLLVFYLPSIALVGWMGGSFFGVLGAAGAAVAWLVADLHGFHPSSSLEIAYWNAAFRFLVFLTFGLLFALLRQNRDQLKRVVAETTSELQKEITERSRIQREIADICAAQQRQIAYDLHDGVGQHLSGVAFKAKLLEQKLRGEGSGQAGEAKAITGLINDALRQTRMVARSMESTYGEAHGLKEGLQKLAGELRENSHTQATLKIDESCEAVAAPADMQLFRIAQEAVHNATAHGEAHNVEITLHANEKDILLMVRDDGKGFEGVAFDGMGMRTMRYRAETIGGTLVVTSEPGVGTTVSCRIPKTSAGKPVPNLS